MAAVTHLWAPDLLHHPRYRLRLRHRRCRRRRNGHEDLGQMELDAAMEIALRVIYREGKDRK
jgi:hypothetical protein